MVDGALSTVCISPGESVVGVFSSSEGRRNEYCDIFIDTPKGGRGHVWAWHLGCMV